MDKNIYKNQSTSAMNGKRLMTKLERRGRANTELNTIKSLNPQEKLWNKEILLMNTKPQFLF